MPFCQLSVDATVPREPASIQRTSAALAADVGNPIDSKEIIMSKMSVSDLKFMLASEKANALAAISAARLMEERADAIDYYLGDMRKDMPAQDGRSRAVSTDVADTIEGLMPSLMDIFAGSDEVVRFEPVGPEDEAAAQQETDYVNHVFMQQNPGFMILYSFVKDALLSSPGLSGPCGSASRSCSENDPRDGGGCRASGVISRASGSLLGDQEGRRPIWRGGRGSLGARKRHFRQRNRESAAMPEVISRCTGFVRSTDTTTISPIPLPTFTA